MRRAALYARVSTRRQEKEATIESQLAQVVAFASQQGDEIPAHLRFVDEAISGKRLGRPALDRLRDGAAVRTFDALYCQSPDRLARNLGAQEVVLAELRRSGIEVIFVNQPSLGDTPQGKLLLDIQGVFAEYERTVISDRMRRGRLYHLRQGQSVPIAAPYGYCYRGATAGQPAQWVVQGDEAAVVEQAFVWYTEEAISLGELAQRLNEQKTPGPAGAHWHASTVGRLLRQPAYKGTAYYNRRQGDESGIGQPRRQGQGRLAFPRFVPRPSEDWIAVPVPAVVDERVWEMAQERLQMKERYSPRNSRRPYLLRSLLVCGVCHHTLQGRTEGDVVRYTCVYGGKHRPESVPVHTCSVRGDVVEPLIWQALAELLCDPQHIRDAWAALQAEEAATPGEEQREQQRRKALLRQCERLLDAYQQDVLTLSELIERKNPLDLELRQLEQQAATRPPAAVRQIALDGFMEQIERALQSTDFEMRQEVLRLLIERIVVDDDALTVEHIIPTVDVRRLHPMCCKT